MTMREPHQSGLPIEELFEKFPRGLAVLELVDPNDVTTWRLAEINALASSLVVPSVQTFLAAERLHLDMSIDLPGLYREQIKQGKAIEGAGLRGMHERVRELGGRLEIESSALGTTVSVVLPLQRKLRKAQQNGETVGPFTIELQMDGTRRKFQCRLERIALAGGPTIIALSHAGAIYGAATPSGEDLKV